MYILGINDGHLATACLLQDGRVIACVSEERFTRIKNETGFPRRAVKWLIETSAIGPGDVDLVCFLGHRAFLGSMVRSEFKRGLSHISHTPRVWMRRLEYRLPSLRPVGTAGRRAVQRIGTALASGDRVKPLLEVLPVPEDRILFVDHHTAHAYCWYGSPFIGKPSLVITLDGEGDGLSGTISVAKDSMLTRIAQIDDTNSLGHLYSQITEYMGMKPLEHEYKVMGLAPYCSEYNIDKTYPVFAELIGLVDDTLSLRVKVRSQLVPYYLQERLRGHRFDSIAGAIQRLIEELIVKLVQNAIAATGIRTVVLSGGVFMNVKANMCVMEMPEVEELFIFPSCGDESGAIGAAYYGYKQCCERQGLPWEGESIRDLYWGPQYTDADIERYIRDHNLAAQYIIEKPGDMIQHVAQLLGKEKSWPVATGGWNGAHGHLATAAFWLIHLTLISYG